MKIFILTQYFPPETGAPQNRLYDLAVKLHKNGEQVTIWTGFPNYPAYKIFEPYKGKFYANETDISGIKIHRSYIFVSQHKSLIARLLNYFSFAFSSLILGAIKSPKQDLIICESPPLFLGITALFLSRVKKAKLLFNVSDLWPESAVKLGLVTNPILIRWATNLEEWIYRHSDYISGQTQGIVENIQYRFPNKPIFWLRNGVDSGEFSARLTGRNWRMENGFKKENFLIYFGGLLGYAQGLDVILKAAGKVKHHPEIRFVIIGEGPEKERLLQLKREMGTENVHFFPGVSKQEIADIIYSIDVGIIPLKKLDLFLGAIPSKIFEILCLGKPVLLGLEGEAKQLFIEEGQAGLAFEPENGDDLAEKVLEIAGDREMCAALGKNGARYARQKFDRAAIVHEFSEFIYSN